MPVSTPNGYLDFTNATPRATKVIATSNVGVGTSNPEFNLDVHGTANVGTLTATTATVSGDVYAPNLPLATIGSNLVTWNDSTGVFQDSGGLFSNKLAVVSEQPPSALAGASTTITNHGVYKVTASTGSPENAFDKSAGTSWTASSDYGGGGGTGVYVPGTARLHTSTVQGDWIALEFPYKTTLRHLTFTGNTEKANLYATNDGGITWTELKNWESGETTVVVDASENYKKYGLVTTKTTGSATLSLTELRFFTESFAIDGGKVAMASGAITGGNTIMDQTGPHARHVVPLRKYPEVFLDGPTTNSEAANDNEFIYGAYKVTTSSTHPNNGRLGWRAFNGDHTSGWISASGSWNSSTDVYQGGNGLPGGYTGEWIKLELPHKIKVERMVIEADLNGGRRPLTGYLLGSNDDSNWSVIKQLSGSDSIPNQNMNNLQINGTAYYKYIAFLVETISGGDTVWIDEIEYYGYEEISDPDTSVDTKITSQFNLPDTTGVKLYIDGDKGSTATDFSGEGHTLTENNATYDSTEKAWEFSSLSTSNVTMTSGDLAMEGTHPHSVSLWFNVANVSSNATLFHVGTAAGEGDAKTAISLTETGHLGWIDGGDNQFLSANTWHNLVYATQGGGGVRTCYLDGRKLGDVSVQDTFGDYPPFDMSTYSDRGYMVRASSALGNYPEHYAFDGNTSHVSAANSWISSTNKYDTTSGVARTDTADLTTVDGDDKRGEWIQMEFPHKMVVDYVALAPQTDTEEYRAPKEGVIAGSNDGETWETMHVFTNQTSWTDDVFNNYVIDTNVGKPYKYVRIIIEKVQYDGTTNSNRQYTALAEIKFYGHKENDTTRFPVSSTVLKYPHVAMTGPAQRGYVATASSVWPGYNPWEVFDENNPVGENTGAGAGWASSGPSTSTDTYDGSTGLDLGITSHHTGSVTGEWIQIELPSSIILSSIDIESRSETSYNASGYDHGYPKDVVLYGSSDGSSWSTVKSFTTVNKTASEKHTEAITSSTAYKYYALVVESIHVTSSTTVVWCTIGQLRLYGTEEDLDVVARVGEGLDGKVANFRVYDKYLHEEQALELWDAQKDQFGRAESSVVVHKGRLGVGTTEPSAALTVMDEAEEMEEFPPRAMTAAETYMEGYGVFRATADSHGAGNTSIRHPWKAFIKGTTGSTSNGDNSWLDNSGDFNNTTGVYDGSLTHHIGSVSGEYLQLELPYEIQLSSYSLAPWNYPNGGAFQYADFPRDFIIYGSKDSVSWDIVDTRSGQSSTYQGDVPNYHVNSQKTYKYFVIVVTKINTTTYANGAVYVAIGEWRLFGTRQGQSTLHDGQLTLTKNLTVPRIGPALDADDTPRRDRLVVEYNTSTNPTANGTVKDTSGRGNDINLYNGASYDATEKALVFDGTDDYAAGTQNLGTGTPTHTISGWFKRTSSLSNYTWVFTIGTSAEGQMSGLLIDPTGDIVFDIFNHRIETTHTITNGVWYHFAGVFNGGTTTWSVDTCDVYINGVLESTQTTGTAPKNFNLTGNQIYFGTSTNFLRYFTGKISNFKLYDTALTADEVKRLYDMGRCDEGHHVVNFSKTRVGIGLGDGEVPRADLDVRGSLRIPTTDSDENKEGMIKFNPTISELEFYTSPHNSSPTVSGGTTIQSRNSRSHTFTGNGNLTVTGGPVLIEYLIIGGGGAGGHNHGGGGAGGGYVTGTMKLSDGTYPIVVGAGGSAGTHPSAGSPGGNSTAFGLVAYGGGPGGGRSTPDVRGYSGASGGGGAGTGVNTTDTVTIGGSNYIYSSEWKNITNNHSIQGFIGGNGSSSVNSTNAGNGGGGGGAGGLGGSASGASAGSGASGAGGVGRYSAIDGTWTERAGGGSGGRWSDGTVGTASGGGGTGGAQNNLGQIATSGTDGKGGGGGGGADGGGTGGDGGDGVVIIRYNTS
jgi:hypothetical protein